MTKIVIVNDDNIVSIDGDVETVPFTDDPDIHAIHWDTAIQEGEVEWKNKGIEFIDDFTPYQHSITEHGDAKTAREQQESDDTLAAFNSLTPQQKRDEEYPSIEDQLSALHYDRGGDPVPLAAIDAAMDIVDADHPL